MRIETYNQIIGAMTFYSAPDIEPQLKQIRTLTEGLRVATNGETASSAVCDKYFEEVMRIYNSRYVDASGWNLMTIVNMISEALEKEKACFKNEYGIRTKLI